MRAGPLPLRMPRKHHALPRHTHNPKTRAKQRTCRHLPGLEGQRHTVQVAPPLSIVVQQPGADLPGAGARHAAMSTRCKAKQSCAQCMPKGWPLPASAAGCLLRAVPCCPQASGGPGEGGDWEAHAWLTILAYCMLAHTVCRATLSSATSWMRWMTAPICREEPISTSTCGLV